MPRMPSNKEDRVNAGIDLKGQGIGTSGQSIWLKKQDVKLDTFLCVLGWVNSSYFLNQLVDAKVTLRATGFELCPNEVYKLKVPEHIFCKDMINVVKKVLRKSSVTVEDLRKIDSICYKKLLSSRKAA